MTGIFVILKHNDDTKVNTCVLLVSILRHIVKYYSWDCFFLPKVLTIKPPSTTVFEKLCNTNPQDYVLPMCQVSGKQAGCTQCVVKRVGLVYEPSTSGSRGLSQITGPPCRLGSITLNINSNYTYPFQFDLRNSDSKIPVPIINSTSKSQYVNRATVPKNNVYFRATLYNFCTVSDKCI